MGWFQKLSSEKNRRGVARGPLVGLVSALRPRPAAKMRLKRLILAGRFIGITGVGGLVLRKKPRTRDRQVKAFLSDIPLT
jgi:hypothetical protein